MLLFLWMIQRMYRPPLDTTRRAHSGDLDAWFENFIHAGCALYNNYSRFSSGLIVLKRSKWLNIRGFPRAGRAFNVQWEGRDGFRLAWLRATITTLGQPERGRRSLWPGSLSSLAAVSRFLTADKGVVEFPVLESLLGPSGSERLSNRSRVTRQSEAIKLVQRAL